DLDLVEQDVVHGCLLRTEKRSARPVVPAPLGARGPGDRRTTLGPRVRRIDQQVGICVVAPVELFETVELARSELGVARGLAVVELLRPGRGCGFEQFTQSARLEPRRLELLRGTVSGLRCRTDEPNP